MNPSLFVRWACGVMGLLGAVSAVAQSAPISLVVGYSPGGSADFVARVVGEELSRKLGRQIIIEKRLEGTELSVQALVAGRTINQCNQKPVQKGDLAWLNPLPCCGD